MPVMPDREILPRRYDTYRAAMGTGRRPRPTTWQWVTEQGERIDVSDWRIVPTATVSTVQVTADEPMAEWEQELLATTEREESEVPTDEGEPLRQCAHCGTTEERGYNYIQWREIDGGTYCHGCTDGCLGDCGTYQVRNRRRNVAFRERGGYCDNCDMHCWNCGNTVDELNGDDHANHSYGQLWNDRVYCNACIQTCPDCGERETSDSMITVGDTLYCEECVSYCDNCGEYSRGRCPCTTGDRVRGYGATTATMWLGGPLPKDEYDNDVGYYVGFELEIAATAMSSRHIDVTPIKDWAEENLGHREALDCKHDGSVSGFEIASQPMTPAFFEGVDWESFMEVLNQHYPLSAMSWTDEPREHGLHVHIGRVAFRRDDVAMAAYSYLLSQDDHLERIGRRQAYHYCAKVEKPVSAAVVQSKPYGRQGSRLQNQGIRSGRDAVNLTNNRTIEIRAFKSTRSANELRDAVRATYLAAEYVRELRSGGWKSTSQALHWLEFSAWVGAHYPQAFASISGIAGKPGSNRFPEPPRFWM